MSLDDAAHTIQVSDAEGRNLLKIQAQTGVVRVEAATKVVIEAPQIALGENGAHPVAFGDSLLQYLSQLVALFNSHVHPGELAGDIPVTPAPPVPVLPAPIPALLSDTVKTE